jgi:hypothetical protein
MQFYYLHFKGTSAWGTRRQKKTLVQKCKECQKKKRKRRRKKHGMAHATREASRGENRCSARENDSQTQHSRRIFTQAKTKAKIPI